MLGYPSRRNSGRVRLTFPKAKTVIHVSFYGLLNLRLQRKKQGNMKDYTMNLAPFDDYFLILPCHKKREIHHSRENGFKMEIPQTVPIQKSGASTFRFNS